MTDTPDLLPGQARDVVTFGHETARVMSNGAIVGRSEPFAKVFASWRAVKRKVGVTAWAILEGIALDAHRTTTPNRVDYRVYTRCAMSETTTIRVDRSTHQELRRLSDRDQLSISETVARAVRALRQDEMGRQLAAPTTEDDQAWLDADLG